MGRSRDVGPQLQVSERWEKMLGEDANLQVIASMSSCTGAELPPNSSQEQDCLHHTGGLHSFLTEDLAMVFS